MGEAERQGTTGRQALRNRRGRFLTRIMGQGRGGRAVPARSVQQTHVAQLQASLWSLAGSH